MALPFNSCGGLWGALGAHIRDTIMQCCQLSLDFCSCVQNQIIIIMIMFLVEYI